MKDKLFVGIDNGKHGAIAIIDVERNIIDAFKYDEMNPVLLYQKLKPYVENYELRAFVEKPIVVYGLAHQTTPFETIGRHKMTLEILGIPYKMGNPASNAIDNWKRIIGLFDDAKAAATQNTKDISALNKRAREIRVRAELLGYSERDLLSDKIAYMDKQLAELATELRNIKKQTAKLRGDKKSAVKNTSVDACLKFFPESNKYIEIQPKTKRAVKKKYDDDIAEALLLAECGRTLHINGNF